MILSFNLLILVSADVIVSTGILAPGRNSKDGLLRHDVFAL